MPLGPGLGQLDGQRARQRGVGVFDAAVDDHAHADGREVHQRAELAGLRGDRGGLLIALAPLGDGEPRQQGRAEQQGRIERGP